MPFQASFAIEAGKIWGYYEPEIRYILDSFNRAATTGTLGISTNGQLWNTLAGTWYVNSSYQAENDNTVTSGVGPYPLTVFDLVETNQLAYANVSPGMGVAFNIQNSNNWYAVTSYNTASGYSCNCSTCYTCCTCTYGCTTGVSCTYCGTTQTGPYSSYPTCGAGCSVQGSSNTGYYCVCCASCTYGCTTGANCSACGSNCNPYSCNCSTCYNYYYDLTVLQSIGGTVYTVSTTSLTQAPASISVKVDNGVVSYYAYSTNISGMVTQPNGLGTLLASGTLTISGTFGTQIGMVKSPSATVSGIAQGTTISGFFGTGL